MLGGEINVISLLKINVPTQKLFICFIYFFHQQKCKKNMLKTPKNYFHWSGSSRKILSGS